MQHNTHTLGTRIPAKTCQNGGIIPLIGRPQQISEPQNAPQIDISGSANVQFGDQYHSVTYQYFDNPAGERRAHESEADFESEMRYKVLADHLSFPGMQSRRHNISSAMPSTCDWIFRHETYLRWMSDEDLHDHCGFLWIKGKPGTGKSTMMKVLESMRRKHPEHLTASYFFNARASSELENSVLGLYRSVVFQLVEALPLMRRDFADRFSYKVRADTFADPWTITELQEFLIDCFCTPASLHATIFVDALDEGHQLDVRKMISHLEDLTSYCTHSAIGNVVRVCFASRHYPSISIRRGLSLVLEMEPAHGDDIRKYIRRKLIVNENPTNSALYLRLEDKSRHVFLWVVLVLPILNGMYDTGSSQSDLLAHLDTIPDELHELLERVLLRDNLNTSKTILLFQWLLFAFDSLSPIQLYSAMTIDSRVHTDFDEPKATTINRLLLIWSKGLVETINHDGKEKVQFIHETVREFLRFGNGMALLDPAFEGCGIAKGHDVLRSYCQQQIEFITRTLSPSNDSSLLERMCRRSPSRFAISKYAVSNVLSHAELAQRDGIPQTAILRYLNVPTNFSSFQYQLLCLHVILSRCHTLLSFLIRLHERRETNDLILCLIDDLISRRIEILDFETVLQDGCKRGDPTIVKRLLDAQTDTNREFMCYENNLITALMSGRDEMVDVVARYNAPVSISSLRSILCSIEKCPGAWTLTDRIENLRSRIGDAGGHELV